MSEEDRLARRICGGWDVCQSCKTHVWGTKLCGCSCGAAKTCIVAPEEIQNRGQGKQVPMCKACVQRGLYALDNTYDMC